MALRRFLYLDEEQLNQYVSQIEDGLRRKLSRTSSSGTAKEAGAELKIVKGGLSKESAEALTEDVEDTGPAKFERLTRLIEGNESDFGWITVLQNADMDAVQVGSLIDVTADLYAADITKLGGAGGVLGSLPLMKQMARMADNEGVLAGLPSADQLDTIGSFMSAMPEMILRGDILETDWSLVAQLDDVSSGDIEGETRLVGKVSKRWGAGSWRALPGLPIVSAMPREQRREFERKGPTGDNTQLWVEGPAVQLDILAIYR